MNDDSRLRDLGAEVAGISFWTVVEVDIDEVETDDPPTRLEDHRLLSMKFVVGNFVIVSWGGVKLR
ncbi:hypothetical protein [Haloarcula marina]|uniref:hypothetical protein n=1 Tax=Haloarcula marina TaxID=2961574 RepID=UPI0020B6BDB3|nr:hypothetical protein [Halomicroarcula marina]